MSNEEILRGIKRKRMFILRIRNKTVEISTTYNEENELGEFETRRAC